MDNNNESKQNGNLNQASSSFSNDEKREEKKQERKEAAEKTGALAGRAVADYFTGGKYEKVRNMPVVGNVAKGAEKVVGKVVGAADALTGRQIGRATNRLNKSGALDKVGDAASVAAGSKGEAAKTAALNAGNAAKQTATASPNPNANGPKNTNPNPEAFSHSNSLDPENQNKIEKSKAENKPKSSKLLPQESGDKKPEETNSNVVSSSEASTTIMKEPGGIKAVGCIIVLMLGFILFAPVILLAGGMNVSSVSDTANCTISGADCKDENSISLGEKLKNLLKYGTFGSNAEALADKVVDTYNEIYEKYDFAINTDLLTATIIPNMDDLNVEYDSEGNQIINDDVMDRLEYLADAAELQIIFGDTVYYCNEKDVNGKTTYYLSLPEAYYDEASVITGKCNASNVGRYLRVAEKKYDEEEYFKKLEGNEIITLMFPDYKGSESIVVDRIKNQYSMYKLFSRNEEDVGTIPSAYMIDPAVNLQTPLRGNYYITSPFGNRGAVYSGTNLVAEGAHLGIDVVSNDHVIYAAGNGVVTRANSESTGGNIIEITHTTSTGEKFISQYAHLSQFLVSKGDTVYTGDEIAIMGSTGAATGVHLHFGIKNLSTGEWLNPKNLFSGASNY